MKINQEVYVERRVYSTFDLDNFRQGDKIRQLQAEVVEGYKYSDFIKCKVLAIRAGTYNNDLLVECIEGDSEGYKFEVSEKEVFTENETEQREL